jgi:hypothetical protein
MLTSYKAYRNLSVEERLAVDQFLPRWQRYLNTAYEIVFEPINKVLSYFDVQSTKQMIAVFDATHPESK